MEIIYHDDKVHGEIIASRYIDTDKYCLYVDIPNFQRKRVYDTFTGKIVVNNEGSEFTLERGFLHSFNDNPALVRKHQHFVWLSQGLVHRENGPALCNRVDGEKFYINGVPQTFKEFLSLAKITDEEKLDLVLKYG